MLGILKVQCFDFMFGVICRCILQGRASQTFPGHWAAGRHGTNTGSLGIGKHTTPGTACREARLWGSISWKMTFLRLMELQNEKLVMLNVGHMLATSWDFKPATSLYSALNLPHLQAIEGLM